MEEFQVVWSERAYDTLRKIVDYVSQTSPKGAKDVVKELAKTAQTLVVLPRRNPVEPLLSDAPAEYRFLLKWHYKIIYTVLESEGMVLVVGVFDTRQNPDKLKDLTFL